MARILIFDSGLGGLSVFAEVRRRLPEVACVYAADAAAFPYGTKSDEALIARLPALLSGLSAQTGPDLAVLACNTASTVALPAIRAALSVPVVGTVPAVKPAAARSRSGCIGLLGTPGTVRRIYTDQLIADFAPGRTVIRHGSAELVALAEAKLRGRAVARDAVAAAITPLFAAPGSDAMDTVVLACTHFPLVLADLRAAAPRELAWIDSAEAIARRVEELLGDRARPPGAGPPEHVALVTAEGPPDPTLAACFAAYGFARVVPFAAGPPPDRAAMPA